MRVKTTAVAVAIGVLGVLGGSGPAVFYSDGDYTTRELDLSYAEGQAVHLQACTPTSSNAVCTSRTNKGRT